jgi:hypothetical protein
MKVSIAEARQVAKNAEAALAFPARTELAETIRDEISESGGLRSVAIQQRMDAVKAMLRRDPLRDHAQTLISLVAEMADELDRIRPVYDAAVTRHEAYFGPSAYHAAKAKATMNLNKATEKARNQV